MTWRERAACKGATSAMYPEAGGRHGIAYAKAICARCDVIYECDAAGKKEKFGVWGGRAETERNRRRRGNS